jgi:hypothetical protein
MISAIQEVEIGRIGFQGWPRQKVRPPSQLIKAGCGGVYLSFQQ